MLILQVHTPMILPHPRPKSLLPALPDGCGEAWLRAADCASSLPDADFSVLPMVPPVDPACPIAIRSPTSNVSGTHRMNAHTLLIIMLFPQYQQSLQFHDAAQNARKHKASAARPCSASEDEPMLQNADFCEWRHYSFLGNLVHSPYNIPY